MSSKRDKFLLNDKSYMRLALNLARARKGLTGDNPSVGCVITKNDEIISIGQTGYNGRPHAEYNAIKNSFEKLAGSKMYVTLEPCNHHGKTPPCTDLILKHKIKNIVIGSTDPNKMVEGGGIKRLESEGCNVKYLSLIHISEPTRPY